MNLQERQYLAEKEYPENQLGSEDIILNYNQIQDIRKAAFLNGLQKGIKHEQFTSVNEIFPKEKGNPKDIVDPLILELIKSDEHLNDNLDDLIKLPEYAMTIKAMEIYATNEVQKVTEYKDKEIAALKAEIEKERWIPVSERLPDKRIGWSSSGDVNLLYKDSTGSTFVSFGCYLFLENEWVDHIYPKKHLTKYVLISWKPINPPQ